jgi:hypothetical protein
MPLAGNLKNTFKTTQDSHTIPITINLYKMTERETGFETYELFEHSIKNLEILNSAENPITEGDYNRYKDMVANAKLHQAYFENELNKYFPNIPLQASSFFVPLKNNGEQKLENRLIVCTDDFYGVLRVYQFWCDGDDQNKKILAKFELNTSGSGNNKKVYIDERMLDENLQGQGLMLFWHAMAYDFFRKNGFTEWKNASVSGTMNKQIGRRMGARGVETWPLYGFRASLVSPYPIHTMDCSEKEIVSRFVEYIKKEKYGNRLYGLNNRKLGLEHFSRLSDIAQVCLDDGFSHTHKIGKSWLKKSVENFDGELYIGDNPKKPEFEDTVVTANYFHHRGSPHYQGIIVETQSILEKYYPEFATEKSAIEFLRENNREDLIAKYYV